MLSERNAIILISKSKDLLYQRLYQVKYLLASYFYSWSKVTYMERSGSVVECLTPGLENSTRPLVFTSASGCRASGNFDMSQCMRFPTIWYVRPAKPQTSLRIRAV